MPLQNNKPIPILYLLLGLPGAGKTTFAELLAKKTTAIHVSSDELRRELFPRSRFTADEHDRLYEQLDARVERLLQNNESVIYDANLNRYKHRKQKYQLAKRLNADAKLIWVKTPKELSKYRRTVGNPQHDLTPHYETPDEMFERIADVFEPPKRREDFIAIDGENIDEKSLGKIV